MATKPASIGGAVSRGATHVTVGVKGPSGYVLRVFREERVRHPRPGGGYDDVSEYRPIPGKQHVVYGYAAPAGGQPIVPVRFGYAVNEGVPADIWEGWLSQNAESDMVIAGLIFALPSAADVEQEARNRESIRDGLEPLEMDVIDANGKLISRDPRAPVSLAVGRPDRPGSMGLRQFAVTKADAA